MMEHSFKEIQLRNILIFMTEYLRLVIENGSEFTVGHFFILLLQLTEEEVLNCISPYLKVLVEELKVPENEY